MHSSDADTVNPRDLKQLLRLRQARVDAAQATVAARQLACEQAEQAVAQRLALIEANHQSVARHASYIVGAGAVDLPRAAGLLDAYQEKLKEALERNEYGLIDDNEHLQTQQALLRDARALYLREQARHDGLKEALARSRRAIARRADIQAENDADELRPSGPLHAGASATTPFLHEEAQP